MSPIHAPPAPAPNLPQAQSYHPTTFLERGVAVPFTSPMLAGARARPAERGAIELIVPNPSGGRGVYVLPWAGVCQLCRPTVHDKRLNDVVMALPSVTPSAIRQAARAIAAEGLAGREALAAAQKATAGEFEDRLLTNFLLLLELVGQVDPAWQGSDRIARARSAELEQRARRAVAHLAPRLGRGAEAIAGGLEEVAQVFAGIGLPGQSPPPRVCRLLEALTGLRADTALWSRRENEETAAAAMIATVADLTIGCATRTLAEAYALVNDVSALLREWGSTPGRLAQRVARTEWLLDGWEQICLIWQCAQTDADRRAALTEMAMLVPVLPKEVSDWVGTMVDTEVVQRFRKTVSLNEDWRTGASFDRIARNEKLRALAA